MVLDSRTCGGVSGHRSPSWPLALFGLIVLLAVLQYRWLGQISEAERAQRRTTLAAGALEFAQDFDREVTRAYLLFQTDAPIAPPVDDVALEGGSRPATIDGRRPRAFHDC